MRDNDRQRMAVGDNSGGDDDGSSDDDGASAIDGIGDTEARRLAATIVALRLQKGLATRYALAKAAGVSIAYIGKLEEAKSSRPSMRHLQRVAAVLGTTAEALLFRDDVYAAQDTAPALIQRLVRTVSQERGKPLSRHTAAAIEEILTLLPAIEPQTQDYIVGIMRSLVMPSAAPSTTTGEQGRERDNKD